jgi:glycosyltransferase involved in cell wall biosynthesis
MRAIGVPARIALGTGPPESLARARAAYPDADEVFVPWGTETELQALARDADVVVATHYLSVAVVARLQQERADFLPAYYVQDYEPFLVRPGTPDADEARRSYELIPDQLLFAKTDWLANLVSSIHAKRVQRVEPSIDETVFFPPAKRRSKGPPVIAAMVRPRTPRRQPGQTVRLLDRLLETAEGRAEVVTFGCPMGEFESLEGSERLRSRHRGVLTRDQVADVLREADVFLDFSAYQAFGRTALEAMACGATAIVPLIGGAHEYAVHERNSLVVDTFDPDGGYRAALRLIEDGDLLRRLQDEALETASRYSSLRAAISEYVLFAHEHERRFSRRASAPLTPARGRAHP